LVIPETLFVMKRSILIFLAAIAALASYACKCYQGTFDQEVQQADKIFMGTVLMKTASDKAYYLFSVSQGFKGVKADTITVKTGFGGGDCGMNFEVGKTYVVYAQNEETNICHRNALADKNTDLGKLRYLFENGFSADIGKTINPVLTGHESAYLNADLSTGRKDFDFYGKKVAFFISGSFRDKVQYFENYGGRHVAYHLVILNEKEKQEANGYDAIIVLWRKQGVGSGFKKSLIKKLK